MITLTIDNSRSQISGLDKNQLSEICDLLSITEDASYGSFVIRQSEAARLFQKNGIVLFRDANGIPRPVFTGQEGVLRATREEAIHAVSRTRLTYRGYGQRRKTLLDKRGGFGTGLLYLVEGLLKKKGLKFNKTDLRIRPKTRYERLSFPSLPFPPYPEQIAAGEAAKRYERGIIVAPTAFGKSAIIALIIKELAVETLVVVPKVALKHQLTRDLKAWFGDDLVGPLGDDGEGKHLITVENVDALDPKKLACFNCVIIDEYHRSAAMTYRKLNRTAWKGIFYKFGLTATPFRSQDSERLLLESVLSKVIYRVSYKTAVEKGYITPVEAFYIDLPKIPCGSNKWPEVYSSLIVNRMDRNRIINELCTTLRKNDLSAIVLVKEIEHGENLYDPKIPFLKGENDDNTEMFCAFNARQFPVLLGTTGVCGEGVDTKPAEYVIIAGLGKSKNAFMQQVGRALRRYPGKDTAKIIIFRDPSHKWTLEHFKAQCKYLKDEYGVIPDKLSL